MIWTLSKIVMRATAIFCESPLTHCRRLVIVVAVLFVGFASVTKAWSRDKAEAEDSARKLALMFEKERFEFRAEAWVKDLGPDVGKALRVQLFKGNDYRFCIAVPPDSGVHVTGAVLDFDGKPSGEIQPVLDGWGCVLSFKPNKTGVYVVAVRQESTGKKREVPCAVITGYR